MKLFTRIMLGAAVAATAFTAQAQDRTDLLWVLGDATPYGWSCDDATALVATTPTVYTGTMYLEAGKDFKFLTTYDFGNTELRAAEANATPDASGIVALTSVSGDAGDNKIHVTESANYLITVDTEALTAKFVRSAYQESPVRYASLFIVGDVLPTGYSVDKGLAMVQDPATPLIYTVANTEFSAGKFKIATALKGSGTWNPAFWYFRDPADPSRVLLACDSDSQWEVAAGTYTFTVDLATSAITITDNAGISDVTDDNTPAEYYNLQGIRIASPAPGQLLLRRQGTEVSKVLF